MQDFPEYVHYYAIKKYRYQGTPTANDTNRNMLLFRDPTVDGLKTGHTDAAGYCLIATAKRDFPNLQGRRLLAIVLGANSENARANEAQKLLNWGYTAYEGLKLFDANQAGGRRRRSGRAPRRPSSWASRSRSCWRCRPAAARKIKTQVARPDPLVAPFTKGQQVGTLKILSGDQVLREVPLVALEAVEQAGVFGRAWDAIRLWIK